MQEYIGVKSKEKTSEILYYKFDKINKKFDGKIFIIVTICVKDKNLTENYTLCAYLCIILYNTVFYMLNKNCRSF